MGGQGLAGEVALQHGEVAYDASIAEEAGHQRAQFVAAGGGVAREAKVIGAVARRRGVHRTPLVWWTPTGGAEIPVRRWLPALWPDEERAAGGGGAQPRGGAAGPLLGGAGNGLQEGAERGLDGCLESWLCAHDLGDHAPQRRAILRVGLPPGAD